MQTSVTGLMELQEDHQLNCPLRGCGVLGGQNTPVVFPSWCPTKLLQLHNAALNSALLSSFSGIVGGLLCTKIFRFFRRMDINYTASGGQLVVSCRSVKSKEEVSSISQFHIPLRASTGGAMEILLPALQTAQGVSTLGTRGDTH